MLDFTGSGFNPFRCHRDQFSLVYLETLAEQRRLWPDMFNIFSPFPTCLNLDEVQCMTDNFGVDQISTPKYLWRVALCFWDVRSPVLYDSGNYKALN